ncbi:LOW QUALITY PROTEIN: hypothetical protein V1477_006682, partial [Vespula maculifrons]
SDQEELSYNGLKGTKENKHISLTIFFSESIAPGRTGPGSLERDRPAVYAHIFFVQIGAIGADTQENRIGVFRKGSSRSLRPYFFRPDRTNRSQVITNLGEPCRSCWKGLVPPSTPHLGEPDRGHWKGLVAPSRPIFSSSRSDQQELSYNGLKGTNENKHFSLTIFFSEYIAHGRTGPGSLERDRPSVYANIFFEPSYNGLKGTKENKHFSLTIFFSQTLAPRRTGSGSIERARRALYAHIFFVLIGPIGVKTAPGSLESARRAIYAHIFSSISDQKEPSYNGLKGTKVNKHFSLTIFFSQTIAPRRTGSGSLERARRALYAHNLGEPCRGYWKGLVPPSTPNLGEPDRGHWKGLVAPSRPIFSSSRSDQQELSYNGLKGTNENKHFSLTIFFSEYIAHGRTGPGSLERDRPSVYANIFFVQIGAIGAELTNRSRVITHLGEPDRGHWKGLVAPSRPIFSSSRSDQQELSYNGLKGTNENKHFSLTIFFSEYIAHGRTGPGSLERDRPSVYANIFFVQIGAIGADTWENRTGDLGKGSSRRLRPYFFRPDRTNRSQVITGTKENIHFSFTIFFSETVEPRRTVPGLLERARRALYAHIFFVQMGPIGADTWENRTGVLGKGSSRRLRAYFFLPDRTNRSQVITGTKENIHFSFTIFFSETVEPRRTVPGLLERARPALYASIFFVQIGPIGAELHCLKGTKENKHFYLTIFFSQTIAPRRIGPGSDQEEPSYNGLKGTNENKHFSLTIFFSEYIAPRITVPGSDQGEPSYNGLKGTKENKHFSLTIFISQTVAPRRTRSGLLERARRALYAHIFFVNRIGVVGKGSSRPLRPYFFRPDRTNRSRVITHLGEPDRGHWKGLVAPSRPIFSSSRSDKEELSYNGLKGTKENKHFSLTIFFSETIEPRRTGSGYNGLKGIKENIHFSFTIFFSETVEPRRTGPGSLERARRALYAHIFFVQIGPIGAELIRRTGSRSLERARRALYAHIFFVLIGPIGVKNCRTYENRAGVNGKGSSRPLRQYFFRPDRTNRSRVITYLAEPYQGYWKGLVAPSRPIFSSSRSDKEEPSYNGLKGTKENKHFSLTIFFSETIEPRRTGSGSLERASRALYAHIFFVQIGPIGAESRVITHLGERGQGHWEVLVAPSTPIFFRPYRTKRSRVITESSYNGLKGTKENIHFSFTIFFSETVEPRRTVPGLLERARPALSASIFFVQIGPIGAESDQGEPSYNGLKGTKENKHFSLTIFISQTVEPRRTRSGLLERARRALYAHIFFVNRIGVVGKGSSRPLRPYFFRPDRTNRSRVITHLGEPDRGHWKGLVAPSRPIFSSSRSDKEELSYNGLKGTKENKHFSLTIFFSETIEPRRTGSGYNGLKGIKENIHFSFTIFFSETVEPRRTGPGSLERARRALYAHIFFVQIGPIGAELIRRTGSRSLERARRALYAHIFFVLIGPIGVKNCRTYENRAGVNGKGSSRPLRQYFFRPDRTNRSRVITYLAEPYRGYWKGLVAPSRPIFSSSRSDKEEPSYNGLKGTKENKHFSLTIFFSETIEPRRTGSGSLERASRALYAHIFFHLGEPDRGYSKGLVAPSTPIFFSSRSDQQEPSYNGLKGTKENKHFSSTIFFSQTIVNSIGVIGKGSSRPLRPYFFRPDRTNRSRVITHLGEPDRGHWKGLVAPSRPIFSSSRSDKEELSYNEPRLTGSGYNGLKGIKENIHFSFTIFFSETVEPRRTVPRSLERARRALYAHIFFVQIGPIGAELIRFKGNKGKKTFFFNNFFLPNYREPDRGHWKGLVAPSRPIFSSSRSDKEEPSYNGLKRTKENKHFSLTIFFSETIEPRRTGSGSLERASRALYAHIFFVQIGPIGAKL